MSSMQRTPWQPLGAILVALLLGPGAAGAERLTEQFDLPDQPLSNFGTQLLLNFFGPGSGTIVESRAELHFTTDASFDAADIRLMFQAPSQGVPVWQLSGEELGWQGAGSFDAYLTTDELNGVIDLGNPPPPWSLFFVEIHAADFQPLGGQFSNSFFQVDIDPGNPAGLPVPDNASDLRLALGPPAPNPTGGSFSYTIALDRTARVAVRLFDLTGRRVATLIDGRLDAGAHSFSWSAPAGARRLMTGVYYLRLEAGAHRMTRRVVVR